MRRLKTNSSHDLAVSDDMANALTSLRSLMPVRKSDETEENEAEIQEKRLNEIFLKTKKQRMRDIFIQKLKRLLKTNKPEEVKRKSPVKGPCGILVEAFDLPQQLTHLIVFANVIVVLILIVLATFEGFIENFREGKNYAAVLALKIICLFINVAYFILKCSNKSFGSGQNLNYIHEVLKAYAKSGRLFLDFMTIAIEVLTLIVPDLMWVSGVFFFFLIIVLFFTLSDLIQIEAAYLHSQKAVLMWGLIKICLSNIIFAHFMASFILAMSRIDTEKNWMTKVGVDQEQWFVKYFYAFYWGTTIMMTVGFGDVLPGNYREVIITSFLEMFSCILLGYNISEIGHLIGQLRQKNQIVNKKMAIFDRMVKSRPVKTHFALDEDKQKEKQKTDKFNQLQKRIYNHIKQLNNGQNNMEYQMRSQLLAELPEHLRKAYYLEANQRIFCSVLFFNRLKPNTVEDMADKFESKFYYAGQNLLQSKERIMILEEGQIGYGYRKRGSTINGQIFDQVTVNKGDTTVLLTTAFLSLARQNNYDLIAKESSVVWGIAFDDFIQTICSSAIDFQYYFSVLHKHTIDDDEWNCVQCLRCSTEKISAYHCVFNCPRIVYSPFRELTIMKNVSLSDQKLCKRLRKARNRNEYSRSSAFFHKKTFNKLIAKIDMAKKTIVNIMSVPEKYEVQFSRHFDDQQMGSFNNRQISNFSREQLIDLMEIAIRRYETCYEQGFWDIEIDAIYNYQFYFPNYNANRLAKTNVHDDTISPGKIIDRRKFMGVQDVGSEDSIIILDT